MPPEPASSLQVSSVFSVSPPTQHFPTLTYHCTLCCVAALTTQYIITSTSKFWSLLADDTWLFTHCLFDFQFIIMLPHKIFISISINCLFCVIMLKLQ